MLAPETHSYAKIRVVGVGGGGGNAVKRMVEAGIAGVEFLAINTDAQALDRTGADHKLQVGNNLTKGLGAGGDPQVGKAAAEESKQEIMMALDGSDMVFLTCGLGGGTGTGACPVVADIARNLGALTIAIVTRPFNVEGPRRKRNSEEGYEKLKSNVDAIIVIPNDNLLGVIEKKTSLSDAFKTADDVLKQGVQGISEVIVVPGLINLDFADVRAILSDAGAALLGIGVGTGEHRAAEAAKMAVSSPLLEQSIRGAEALLFNVSGPLDLTLMEIQEAAEIITASTERSDPDVLMGAVVDDRCGDEVRITVVATGFELGTGLISRQQDAIPLRPQPLRQQTPQPFGRQQQQQEQQHPEVGTSDTQRPMSRPTGFGPAPGGAGPQRRPGPIQPATSEPAVGQPRPIASTSDDDLDIPAFLRKR